MNLVRKMLSALGGILLAALLIAALAPKATRGIVAAFVQVANTPTTAIPVVQAPPASALYIHTCSGPFTGLDFASCGFPPVPAGQTLFLETFTVFVDTDSSNPPDNIRLIDTQLSQQVPFNIVPIHISDVGGTSFYTAAFSGRIAMSDAAGAIPACVVGLINSTSIGHYACSVSGYLAPGS